jgi:hypothetical protein
MKLREDTMKLRVCGLAFILVGFLKPSVGLEF